MLSSICGLQCVHILYLYSKVCAWPKYYCFLIQERLALICLGLGRDLVPYSSMRLAVEAAKRGFWTVLILPHITAFTLKMLQSAATQVYYIIPVYNSILVL